MTFVLILGGCMASVYSSFQLGRWLGSCSPNSPEGLLIWIAIGFVAVTINLSVASLTVIRTESSQSATETMERRAYLWLFVAAMPLAASCVGEISNRLLHEYDTVPGTFFPRVTFIFWLCATIGFGVPLSVFRIFGWRWCSHPSDRTVGCISKWSGIHLADLFLVTLLFGLMFAVLQDEQFAGSVRVEFQRGWYGGSSTLQSALYLCALFAGIHCCTITPQLILRAFDVKLRAMIFALLAIGALLLSSSIICFGIDPIATAYLLIGAMLSWGTLTATTLIISQIAVLHGFQWRRESVAGDSK